MLSRARHGIVITRAESLISKKGHTYPTRPSPWADEIRAGFTAGKAELLAHIADLP